MVNSSDITKLKYFVGPPKTFDPKYELMGPLGPNAVNIQNTTVLGYVNRLARSSLIPSDKTKPSLGIKLIESN